MASLILPLLTPEPALLETLAGCVPAVAEGLIRDALVTAPARTEELDHLLDAAGCQFVPAHGSDWDHIRAAAPHARSEWLIVIQPGWVPLSGWMGPVADFLAQNDPTQMGVARLALRGSFPQRLAQQARGLLARLDRKTCPSGAILHRTMLATPQLLRQDRLDWTLADRRRRAQASSAS